MKHIFSINNKSRWLCGLISIITCISLSACLFSIPGIGVPSSTTMTTPQAGGQSTFTPTTGGAELVQPTATIIFVDNALTCSDLLPLQIDPSKMAQWFDCVIRSGSQEVLLTGTVKKVITYKMAYTDCQTGIDCWPTFSPQDAAAAIVTAAHNGQPGCMGYSTASGLMIVYQGLAFDRTILGKKFVGEHYIFAFDQDISSPSHYSLSTISAVAGGIAISAYQIPYACSPGVLATPSEPASQATLSASSYCAGALPTRLQVNGEAYASYNPPISSRLRQSPGTDSPVVGQIGPGTAVMLLAGPQCVDQMIWWKVQVLKTNQVAWTAEGDSQGYWLIPCTSGSTCGK